MKSSLLTLLDRPMLRWALVAILVLALLYALLIGTMLFNQERMLFYPSKLADDFQFNKPGVVERTVNVPGATLSALHFKQEKARGLIFFLHGNAGNLDIWLPSTEFYREAGYDLFMIDYRGFGKSTGRIESEAQLHADVRASWDAIAPEYADRPVVIYGRSLGTGLATKLASEVEAAQLVLVSPYSSFVQLGKDHFPWIPSFATRYPMRTDEWLARVTEPVMLIHGGQDALIKPSHAESLKREHPSAELLIIPQAGHDDIHSFPIYLESLQARLASLTPPP